MGISENCQKISVDFTASWIRALTVDLANCTFPEAATYTVQIHFWMPSGSVLKHEEPFLVWQEE